MSSAPGERSPRVVIAAQDPRHHGGIIGVLDSWRASGLGERVELIELPTSAWDDPRPAQAWQALRAAARLTWILSSKRRRPDLAHLHASIGGSLYRKLALARICKLFGVPYIVHLHSGSFSDWVEGSRVRTAASRSLFSGAAVSVVLAESWREPVEALGVERVEVVPNGVSEAERQELERCREMRGASPSDPEAPAQLLFYGRWTPLKGPDRIATALRELGREDFELHVYGNGDRAWLERCFEGVGGRSEIRGWLEGEEKLAELAAADALIAPSRAEGLPMSLVEARAAGVPVIATAVGGVADALAGYEPAVLLGDGDAEGLREAIAAVLDRRWPGELVAGELPAALTAEAITAQIEKLYREVSSAP